MNLSRCLPVSLPLLVCFALGCSRSVDAPVSATVSPSEQAATLGEDKLLVEEPAIPPVALETQKPQPISPKPESKPTSLLKEAPETQQLIFGAELDRPVPDNYLRVPAEVVVWDLQSDDPKINRKYDKRPIQLEGVLKEIGADERGKFIKFYTTLPVPFYLENKKVEAQVDKLKPGDKAALRCSKGVSPLD